MKDSYIYIMTNENNTTLYVGVTSNLIKRVYEHKNHIYKGFTDKYNCTKLVWFESTTSMESAIQQEKRMKKWNRQYKINLVEKINPKWNDLSDTL